MRKTDVKHKEFINIVAHSVHLKYNSRAQDGIFVEVYQLKSSGNKSYQKWVTHPDCKVVIFGNEKIIYMFDTDTLKKMATIMPIKPNSAGTGYGFVLSAEEAKKRCKYWYNL